MKDTFNFIDLAHDSLEFDATYSVISRDIAPEYLETAQYSYLSRRSIRIFELIGRSH